jgi:hypothetical protein
LKPLFLCCGERKFHLILKGMNKMKLRVLKIWTAPLLWSGAIAALFFMDDSSGTSLCFFRFAGFTSCPGCGIGHAIHYALNLDPRSSLQAHILGIPSAVILIIYCFRLFYTSTKALKNGPENAYDASRPSATGVCRHQIADQRHERS